MADLDRLGVQNSRSGGDGRSLQMTQSGLRDGDGVNMKLAAKFVGSVVAVLIAKQWRSKWPELYPISMGTQLTMEQ